MKNKVKVFGSVTVCLSGLCLALPALSQQAKDFPMGDATKAREMAKIINEGQPNRRDATALAETHINGTAIGVVCDISIGPIELKKKDAKDPPPSNAPSSPLPERSQSRRLIYKIKFFANEQIQTVSADGLNNSVTGSDGAGD